MDKKSEIRRRLEKFSPAQLRLLEAQIRQRQAALLEPGTFADRLSAENHGASAGFTEPQSDSREFRAALQTDLDAPRDPEPLGVCLHEMFEHQVRRVPKAVAMVYEGRPLTYSELDTRANALATRLRARNVGPETRVGILLERSPDLVVAVLGILKVGGVYVPIDPAYPDERVSLLLSDAKPALVVTSERLAGRMSGDFPTVAIHASDAGRDLGTSSLGTASSVTPDNLAYVMYTSGSTGLPKGVMITHRSVVNVLTWVIEQLQLTERDVVLSVASICFDISVAETFLPLALGGRLVLVNRETAMDGRRLARLIDDCGATFIQPTPATYRLLLEAGWGPKPGLTMVSTGERLPADLARQLAGRGPALWNLYGPTETTIWSTGVRIDDPRDSITIGRPLAKTQTYILDAGLRPVSTGMSGELFIGGAGLARGYLQRADLTAERFIPDPFSTTPGARLYRTGDLARFLADGRIECLGRLDHQVKIRGYRIELEEIEATLARHSEVCDVVVLARESASGEPRLAAFVAPPAGSSISITELREFLKGKLPEYMVPVEMILMDRLPLTANGKVDRRSLLDRVATPMEQPAKEASSDQKTRRQMIEIWRELLSVEAVRMEDDFFDLGGHSLLAMRLIARVERAFGVTPALRALFEYSTLAAFCDHCDEIKQQGATVPGLANDRIEGRI